MTNTTQKVAATTEKVTLIEIEAPSYNIAHGDDTVAKKYDVYVGDTHIGTVANGSRESWRKSGRIRTHFNGYTRHWDAEQIGGWSDNRRGWRAKSRKAAVETLVTAYVESQAGAK